MRKRLDASLVTKVNGIFLFEITKSGKTAGKWSTFHNRISILS